LSVSCDVDPHIDVVVAHRTGQDQVQLVVANQVEDGLRIWRVSINLTGDSYRIEDNTEDDADK
jgi:hypothetical protein